MNEANQPRPASRRRFVIVSSLIGAVAVLAGTAAVAKAHMGWGHHGGPVSAQRIEEGIERGVKYVLSDIDASKDQKAQVTAILQTVAQDVYGLKDQHVATRNQIREILSAQTIDRKRLESARESELRLADQASQRLFQGIADAAEVLTPEQRAQLAQKMEERHKRRQ